MAHESVIIFKDRLIIETAKQLKGCTTSAKITPQTCVSKITLKITHPYLVYDYQITIPDTEFLIIKGVTAKEEAQRIVSAFKKQMNKAIFK